ncbi:MAG: hypothetical protein KBD06_04685 [Candidatus Pacebacteria bacterium]|nr:hypothetical protein [Candidatus Paceibacterota bacterium]
MNKNIVIVCVLILAAGGLYAYYSDDQAFRSQQMPQFAAETASSTVSETAPTGGEGIGKHSVTWKFEKVGEDTATGAEQTKVTVVWDGKSHDAGTYMGSCAELDGSTGTLSEGEVSGALCWFAGAGDEIGVFNENGIFVLKHGEQQEPSAEAQGFRGNFKTLLTL